MGRSRTRYLKAGAIASQTELSSVLVRLMLSINDISLAADANDAWASTTEQHREFRKGTARMYFIRVLMGHVFEGLSVVREISRSAALRAAVDRCDAQTLAAFRDLEAFIDSAEMKVLDKIRNRASFHYDRQLPERSLQEIAELSPDKPWSYSMGSEALDWHFELADAVIDRMLIREVFGLKQPKGLQRTEKTELIAARLQEISITFTNFAAHFVEHYSR
jgi:hypothetical protein